MIKLFKLSRTHQELHPISTYSLLISQVDSAKWPKILKGSYHLIHIHTNTHWN